MPSYEVLIKGYIAVVVQDVDSEEEALDLAWENVNRGDFELEDASIEQELSDEDSLNRAIRHCNKVI